MARLAGDLDLFLLVLPLAAVAHQVGVEVAVDAGEAREAVDVGVGAAGGAAVVERGRGVAAGARLVLLHLVEPLVGQRDPAAPAVAAEAAVVGDARVDGGVRARNGAGEPARDVTGGAAAAVAVDGVVAVSAEGVEVAPGAELRKVALGGGLVGFCESLDHRRRPAWLGELAEDPSVDRDDAARPRHERRGDPLRLADVAAGAAAGASHGAQRARLGLHSSVRADLVERELVAEWHDEQPTAARAWAPPGPPRGGRGR